MKLLFLLFILSFLLLTSSVFALPQISCISTAEESLLNTSVPEIYQKICNNMDKTDNLSVRIEYNENKFSSYYTKGEIDILLENINDFYTKGEMDILLNSTLNSIEERLNHINETLADKTASQIEGYISAIEEDLDILEAIKSLTTIVEAAEESGEIDRKLSSFENRIEDMELLVDDTRSQLESVKSTQINSSLASVAPGVKYVADSVKKISASDNSGWYYALIILIVGGIVVFAFRSKINFNVRQIKKPRKKTKLKMSHISQTDSDEELEIMNEEAEETLRKLTKNIDDSKKAYEKRKAGIKVMKQTAEDLKMAQKNRK